jgi:fumarate reductase subunit D
MAGVSMARSNEPLWYGPFAAGMMIGALFIPALIIITGILVPLGSLGDSEHLRTLVNHPLTRLLLFLVISFSLFHWAHRFRYILFDVGVHGGKSVIAFLCYGTAMVGTILTAALALHLL